MRCDHRWRAPSSISPSGNPSQQDFRRRLEHEWQGMRDLVPRLSVVCPVYNEGANIGNLLLRLEVEIEIPIELIVVYDMNEDDTLPVLAQRNPRFPVRTVKNQFGRGALNAIKTGFQEAQCDATLVIM